MGVSLPVLGVPGVVGGGPASFGGGISPVYGVSWNKSSNPALTRTDAAVGMVAAAGVDAGVVTNDFDSAEIFGEITEVTDALGNVFVRIPKFYIEKTDGVGYKTWRVSKTGGGTGYLPWCFWDFTNGVALDYVDVGKYPASVSGGKMQSVAGVYPTVNTNIVDFRTAAQANGAGYQQLDIHVVDVLQTLFYIEFATLNSQAIMAGYTAGLYSTAHTLTADTSPAANVLVVTNATGALYAVGQAISVGTSLGGNQRFYGRTITNIQADTPSAGSTTITFDGDPVALTTGDILYNTGWLNDFSGWIEASSGSLVSNSSGKYPMMYRGIENLWGNLWQFIDGVNVNGNQGWVCLDASDYASNLFAAPYAQLGYGKANSNGYVSATGWDASHPFAAFPVGVAGNSGTYFSDFYYQETGQRMALWGGGWNVGQSAGLSCWDLRYASSSASIGTGARLVRKAG